MWEPSFSALSRAPHSEHSRVSDTRLPSRMRTVRGEIPPDPQVLLPTELSAGVALVEELQRARRKGNSRRIRHAVPPVSQGPQGREEDHEEEDAGSPHHEEGPSPRASPHHPVVPTGRGHAQGPEESHEYDRDDEGDAQPPERAQPLMRHARTSATNPPLRTRKKGIGFGGKSPQAIAGSCKRCPV